MTERQKKQAEGSTETSTFWLLCYSVLLYSLELPCFYSICWGLVLNCLVPDTNNELSPAILGALSQNHTRQGLRAREHTKQTRLQSGLPFLSHCTEAGNRLKPGARRRALLQCTHCSGTFSAAAAAAMKHAHRRIMKFSCLGFSIW